MTPEYNKVRESSALYSFNRGIDKEDVALYIQWTILSHKNEIMPLAVTWMDLEIIVLREVSQRRQVSYNLAYMWSLKKK